MSPMIRSLQQCRVLATEILNVTGVNVVNRQAGHEIECQYEQYYKSRNVAECLKS